MRSRTRAAVVFASRRSTKALEQRLREGRQLRIAVTETRRGTGAVGGRMHFIVLPDKATCAALRAA